MGLENTTHGEFAALLDQLRQIGVRQAVFDDMAIGVGGERRAVQD